MGAKSEEPARITLVIPVYNEEEAIAPFFERLHEVFEGNQSIALDLLFINDGSTDRTLEVLLTRQLADERVSILELSRNFGKEAALTAGLDEATGDAVVPIDIDLQEPPELIPEMVRLWQSGFDVVLAKRRARAADGWMQRNSARLFYWTHNLMADPELPFDVGDFRLMDRSVVNALKSMPETRRFMKGLFAWAGFRTTSVEFDRPARSSGQSSFNTWRLWNLALEGITSFSTSLLRIWTYVGIFIALASFVYAGWLITRVLVHGVEVPGYASLAVMIMFLGGIQLVGTGILGEYLGRAYLETKRRPVYILRKRHTASSISKGA